MRLLVRALLHPRSSLQYNLITAGNLAAHSLQAFALQSAPRRMIHTAASRWLKDGHSTRPTSHVPAGLELGLKCVAA